MNSPYELFTFAHPLFRWKHWRIYLHPNQSYLGRCIVALDSRLCENPLEITPEERNELWEEIFPKLERALKWAFQCDRLNFSTLNNTIKQVHWHVVPRYELNPVREFAGIRFEDTKVGRHYAPAPDGIFSPQILEMIATEVQRYYE